MRKLIIIGSGGHGRVIADCAQQIGNYSQIDFLDDCYLDRQDNNQWSVIGLVKDFTQHIEHADFIVAYSDGSLRKQVMDQLLHANATLVTLVHPSAVVSPNSIIGKGVVIFANAVINIGAKISDGCIINTGSTVDHDCIVKHCVHISPGVSIGGGVRIAPFCWLGIGSTVIDSITLADNTQLGAGAVVTQSTQANSLYVGVPAKRIRSLAAI